MSELIIFAVVFVCGYILGGIEALRKQRRDEALRRVQGLK